MPNTLRFWLSRSTIRRDRPDDTVRKQETDWNGGKKRSNEEDYRRQASTLRMEDRRKWKRVLRNHDVASKPHRVDKGPPHETQARKPHDQVEEVPRTLSARCTFLSTREVALGSDFRRDLSKAGSSRALHLTRIRRENPAFNYGFFRPNPLAFEREAGKNAGHAADFTGLGSPEQAKMLDQVRDVMGNGG